MHTAALSQTMGTADCGASASVFYLSTSERLTTMLLLLATPAQALTTLLAVLIQLPCAFAFPIHLITQ